MRKKKVLAFLNSLGDTPDQVAATLLQREIMVESINSKSCPIAEVLNQEFPDKDEWYVVCSRSWVNGLFFDMKVNNPKPVQQFITKFDNLEYPEFVKETW